ncbi:MAG: DegT/DnrJ/EryC1/StrS family aminotransferase [Emcibacteraceae bacterium]|nr:DegT/DnrJ/EryC1/StrS family aminotransferase [Emcibacteraceae bacterium]
MTDIQAALGLSQMHRLDDFISIRNELANRYDELLKGLPIEIPYQTPEYLSARHLYIIKINNAKNHQHVFEGMREYGIGVNIHYIPVHLQPYYKKMGHKTGDYPIAERHYSKAISIPLYTQLEHSQQDKVLRALKELFPTQ